MQILLESNELVLTALKQASLSFAWLNGHVKVLSAQARRHRGFARRGSEGRRASWFTVHFTACISFPFFTSVSPILIAV